MPTVPDARLAYRPFAEQVAFFERKVNAPTERWDDLKHGDHAHGFMVAGAQRAALLDDLRAAVGRSIEQGRTFEQFQADFEDIVAKNGWTGWTGEGSARGRAWRARVIYDTNLRQSYNAGRYAQLTHPDMLAVRPYWQYRHNDRGVSKTPRPEHAAWDGKVIRADDPWWSTHYPSNGWGCKCGVRPLAEDDLKRQGLRVEGAPTPVDDTAGIDPGFDYNIGEAARSLPAAASYGQKMMAMPASWRDIALADAQKRQVDWGDEWTARASAAVERVKAGVGDHHGHAAPVGFLRPRVATELSGRGLAQTALLAAHDGDIMHSLRDNKATSTRHGRSPRDAESLQKLVADMLEDMPRRLAISSTSVLLDTSKGRPALIFAFPLQSGQWVKYVFGLDERVKSRRAKTTANWLTTIDKTAATDLRRLTLLDGPAP